MSDEPDPFVTGATTVHTVIVGIDDAHPPNQIQLNLDTAVQTAVNRECGFEHGRGSVKLTTHKHIPDEYEDTLGPRTLYAQQYDVDVGNTSVSAEAVESVVVEKLSELGFSNITGTLARTP